MKLKRVPTFIFLFFLLPLTGSLSHAFRHHPSNTQFDKLSSDIRAIFLKGDYIDAISLYRRAAQDAEKAGEPDKERLFLTNAGACELGIFKYRAALATLLKVRTLSVGSSDRAGIARVDTNLSTVYSQMGNLSEATNAADEALKYQDSLQPRARAVLMLQAGNVKAQSGHLSEAEPLFLKAIDAAYEAGELETAAWGWDYLGYSRRKEGHLDAAESAETEGFRLRLLGHLSAIESSYMNLGAIQAQRGNTASALTLLNEAETALHKPTNRTRPWYIYTERGRVKLQAGMLAEALADLRKAVELARVWRADVVANDANRSSSEEFLADLYDLLVEAGNRLYLENHDPALLRETFEAAEENRAGSLRALVPQTSDWRNHLPDQYWQTLANLNAAQATWLRVGEKAAPAVAVIQSRLAELEAGAGAPIQNDQTLAWTKLRDSLDTDSVLFSFRLGDRQSWGWQVTNQSITLRRLAGRKELHALIASFGATIGKTDQDGSGSRLYRELFGNSNPEVAGKKRWLLALEGDLFEIPFPALPLASGQPLIVAHSIQIVPGAIMLARRTTRKDLDGPFLGVGDPVYNNADPRLRSSASPGAPNLLSRVRLDRNADTTPSEFARLWGAGREIADSARSWGARDSILLTGTNASAASFWSAMQHKPSIIHFATHVVEKNDHLNTGWIALSKSSNGQLDYLTPAQISARSVSARLVVLSGCSSGKADIRTASGLMGLTRAWIATGAGSVLATRWPTVDDNGVFFQSFYRNFRGDPASGPAEALRQASIEMLNSESWRSNPSFWAGYFLVGN